MKITGRNIFSLFAVLALVGPFAGGCTDDKLIDTEKTNIERSIGSEEYEVIDGVYRVVFENAEGREGYESSWVSERGDSVFFWFEARTFSSSVGNKPFWTNKPNLIAGLEKEGLNTEYWSTNRIRARAGHTSLAAGLGAGMTGVRAGDSVVLYVTSDRVTGDKTWGILPEDTPIVWLVSIDEVTKEQQ